MTPELITYLIGLITCGYLIFNIVFYYRNKKRGLGFQFRPLYLIAAGIVFLISLYATATGQTYYDLVDQINASF
ncbi:hypothetical protein ABE099_19095 [Paenibacillus turicensis]|uniref:hypothetical protein n=1 Tax=Paenibacillus turicensis TaxID=160487 RepID=UPI003D272E61